MIRSIKLGLAGFAFAAAASLFLPASAQAADYNGDCAGVPASVSGDANITNLSSTCTIAHAVSATGSISILAGGTVNIHALTAGGDIGVRTFGQSLTIAGNVRSTGSGSISLASQGEVTMTIGGISTTNNIIDISSGDVDILSVTDANSSISVTATAGNLKTTGITNTGGSSVTSTILKATAGRGGVPQPSGTIEVDGAITDTLGYIQITADSTVKVTGAVKTTSDHIIIIAGSTLQTGLISTTLGGAVDLKAQTQGGTAVFTVGGSGHTNGVNGTITTTGLGDDPVNSSCIVYITNPGGITLAATTDIIVNGSSGGRAGHIWLNAMSGNIIIPNGIMSVSNSVGAGQIDLLATQVTFSGAVTLNASQLPAADGVNHQINIAASTISYGSSLTLNADGHGTASESAEVALVPQGALTITDNADPTGLSLNASLNTSPAGSLAISGSGPLIVMGDGNYNLVQILANPISISGTTVTLKSQGQLQNQHGVTISNPVLTGGTGLTLGNSGATTIDVSGNSTWGANPFGGTITMSLDQALFNSSSFVINASATTGNAEGGTISMTSANLKLNPASTAMVTANGAGSLSGASGGTITITSTGTADFTLGSSTGDFSLSANSGATAGAGGNVTVNTGGDLSFSGNFTVTAAGNGVGGTIDFTGKTITIPPTANTVVAATSSGTQSGGIINITATGGGVSVGTANGQVGFNANNTGSGSGGAVNVTAAGATTVDASAINVASGPTAPSVLNSGGTILLTTTEGSINASGTFQASSGPLGQGGTINFQSAQDINLAAATQLVAQGHGTGGTGGKVTLGAGIVSGATGKINYAASNVSIDSSSLSSKGGTIAIQTADPTGTSALQLLGPITNNGALTGAGTVTITNKYPVGLVVQTAIMSAVNGQINFTSMGPVTVTGIAPSGTSGPYFGPVSMSGTILTLQATGSADLLLGGFNASGDINITTDVGNIKSDGSSVLLAPGGTITFNSTSGKVGVDSTKQVNVDAPFVDVEFGSTPVAGTSVFLNAVDDVTIQNVISYGDVFITGSGNVTLSRAIQTTQGSVGITSAGGAIVLNTNKTILVQEGILFLQGQTMVTLQTGSQLKAITTTTNQHLGSVSVTLLGPASGNTSPPPPNVIVSGAPTVLFGAVGITANAPDNTLKSEGGRELALDTLLLPKTQIVLNGGVQITASGQ